MSIRLSLRHTSRRRTDHRHPLPPPPLLFRTSNLYLDYSFFCPQHSARRHCRDHHHGGGGVAATPPTRLGHLLSPRRRAPTYVGLARGAAPAPLPRPPRRPTRGGGRAIGRRPRLARTAADQRESARTTLCAPSPLFFCRGAAVKRRCAPSKAGGSRVTRLAPPPSRLAALGSEENLWLCVFCEGSDAATSINAIRQIIAPAATRAPASKALCCSGVGRVGTGLFLGSHESSSRTPATIDAVSALHTHEPRVLRGRRTAISRNQHTHYDK